MELKRYRDRIHRREYEAVELTPENIEEIGQLLNLEYVKEYVSEDGTVEEALFLSGDADPIKAGVFIVQRVNTKEQAWAIKPRDFDYWYNEIEVHPFVPNVIYSDYDYGTPCVFCGHLYGDVPYHRDVVPGESIKLPDGTNLTITTRSVPDV